jgi:hypothetical protein
MPTVDVFEGDFSYGSSEDAASGQPASLSIFANRSHLRASLRDDAAAAGLQVTACGPLEDLLEAPAKRFGDVVLVDCPQVDGRIMAALSELDQHSARSGTRLIISTTVEALEPVFACVDQSDPILLVDPNRAERILALGRVLTTFPSARLRELSKDDRLMLLRLTEQVGQLAGRLENLVPSSDVGGDDGLSALALGGAAPLHRRENEEATGDRPVRAPLPDPRLVRQIIRQRQLRARFFDGDLFSDPAWDMLLDLTAARAEQKRVSVTSLCIASGVPPTTALRWIGQMVEAGLFVRVCDDSDRRRAFIELTDRSLDGMARYFAEAALSVPAPV